MERRKMRRLGNGVDHGGMNGSNPTVWAVDDDEGMLLWIETALKRSYDVRTRPGLRGLVAALEREPPDLLVLDVHFPDGDGVEAAVRIRRRPALARMPIVLISGDTRIELALRSLASGADMFMEKPIDAARFRRQLRSLLRRRETAAWLARKRVDRGARSGSVAGRRYQLP
ncbi:MAG: response regulator [Elusimicrobiota bacterium]